VKVNKTYKSAKGPSIVTTKFWQPGWTTTHQFYNIDIVKIYHVKHFASHDIVNQTFMLV